MEGTTQEKAVSVWKKSNWAKWKPSRKARTQRKIKSLEGKASESNLYILAENLSIEDEEYYPEGGEDTRFHNDGYSVSCSSSNSSEAFFGGERKAVPFVHRSKPHSEASVASDSGSRDALLDENPSINVLLAGFDEDSPYDTSSELKQKNVFKLMEKIHLTKLDAFKTEEDEEDTSTIGSPCTTPDSVIDLSQNIYKSRSKNKLDHRNSSSFGTDNSRNTSCDFSESRESIEDAFNSLFSANEIAETESAVDGTPQHVAPNSSLPDTGQECETPKLTISEIPENQIESIQDSMSNLSTNRSEELTEPLYNPLETEEEQGGEEKRDECIPLKSQGEVSSDLVSTGFKDSAFPTFQEETGTSRASTSTDTKFRSKSFGSRPSEESSHALRFFKAIGSDFIKEILENPSPSEKSEEDSEFVFQLSSKANLYCFSAGSLISLTIVLFLWLCVFEMELEGRFTLKMVMFYAFTGFVFSIVSVCILFTLRTLAWFQHELIEIKSRLPPKKSDNLNHDDISSNPDIGDSSPSQKNMRTPHGSPVSTKCNSLIKRHKELETLLLVKTRISRFAAKDGSRSNPGSPQVHPKYHSDAEAMDGHPRIISRSMPINLNFSPRGNRDLVLVRRDSCGSDSSHNSMAGSASPIHGRPSDLPKNGFKQSDKISFHRAYSRTTRKIMPDFSLWETRPNQVRLGILETSLDVKEACILFLGKQVLVVDDNAVNRRALGNGLQNLGMVVEFAGNGQEAVDLMSSALHKFFCIFMDLHMPQMDGYEATLMIRKMEKEKEDKSSARRIPIIGLTGDVFGKARRKCLDCDMDELLIKPVSHEIIESLLKKFLGIKCGE